MVKRRRHRHPRWYAPVVLGLAAAGTSIPGHALDTDRLRLSTQLGEYFDTNLARSSTDPISDHITIETVGLATDLTYSRQHLNLAVAASKTQYQRLRTLDYDGRNISGTWDLGIGNPLSGGVTYSDSRTLQNFNNFRSLTKDVINTHSANGHLSYAVDARWHLNAGYTQSALDNTASDLSFNNNHTQEKDIGVSYEPPSGNVVGARRKDVRVVFPLQQEFVPPFFFVNIDNSYRDTIYELYAKWTPNLVSSLTASAYDQQRRFDATAGRNVKGFHGGGLGYNWTGAGRSSFALSVSRDVGGTQFLAAQTVVSDNVSLTPVWAYSQEFSLVGTVMSSNRQFASGPGVVAHQETVRDLGITANWAVNYAAILGLGWRHEDRQSATPGFEYGDRLISAMLSLQF